MKKVTELSDRDLISIAMFMSVCDDYSVVRYKDSVTLTQKRCAGLDLSIYNCGYILLYVASTYECVYPSADYAVVIGKLRDYGVYPFV